MSVKRALIVDDSSTAQYHLKKMLQGYDLTIDSVDSGEAALLYLAKHVPDVVFMDHLMPGMDGFRALQIIKSHPETAMIPVIMYTSKSGDVYTGQARALGALDVISKDSINAVDLSKVMRSIHIEPQEPTSPKPDAATVARDNRQTPTAELTSTPTTTPPFDSDPSHTQPMGADNSRRIELRIVQLEHAIDDSRRVIAAQLIREMQKLRHNLKHEFSSLFKRHEEKQEAVVTGLTAPPEPAPRNRPIGLFIISCLVVLLLAAFLFRQNNHLQMLREQQTVQQEQLQAIGNLVLAAQTTPDDTQQALPLLAESAATYSEIRNELLENFVWAFNQSGFLPYSSALIEPNAIVRINEFIYRLDQQDYRGVVEISFNAGDFCVVMDDYGQTLLPDTGTRMADCLLLSELYQLDALFTQVIGELFLTLSRTAAVSSGDIRVVIRQLEGQASSYPQRQPQLLASEWNGIAQNNNRVNVALRAAEENE